MGQRPEGHGVRGQRKPVLFPAHKPRTGQYPLAVASLLGVWGVTGLDMGTNSPLSRRLENLGGLISTFRGCCGKLGRLYFLSRGTQSPGFGLYMG